MEGMDCRGRKRERGVGVRRRNKLGGGRAGLAGRCWDENIWRVGF